MILPLNILSALAIGVLVALGWLLVWLVRNWADSRRTGETDLRADIKELRTEIKELGKAMADLAQSLAVIKTAHEIQKAREAELHARVEAHARLISDIGEGCNSDCPYRTFVAEANRARSITEIRRLRGDVAANEEAG